MSDLDYFRLRAFLYPRELEQTALLKLTELTEVWTCTLKNVKRKLKKYQAEGLYDYLPGNGRGHLSELRFINPLQKEIIRKVRESIEQEKYEIILSLFQLPIPKNWFASVSEELNLLFGFQSMKDEQDILRAIISRPLSTLDPQYVSIALESFLIRQLGDPLVTYDAKTRSIQPCVAHHWQSSPDHTRWTFYLRKGVLFHHQKMLTSEDVKYTFERFCRLQGAYSWLLQDVQDIHCPSPFTAVIQLREPNPFFIRNLCQGNLAILPKDRSFNEYEWIGTGPFKLKKRTREKIVLEAFDSYFLERPLLDRIEFWLVEDSTYRVFSMKVSGEEEGDFIERRDIRDGFSFLAFNLRRETVVRHPSFRKAIYHLLDVHKMYQDLGRDQVYPASSFFAWKSKIEQKDPEQIRPLLAEAGYNGEILSLFGLKHPKVMEDMNWLAAEAAKYGVNLQLDTVDMADEYYTDKIENGADLMFNGEVPSPDFELSFMDAFYNKALIFQRFFLDEDLAYIDSRLRQMCLEESFSARDKIRDEIEAYLKRHHLIVYMEHTVKRQLFHTMIHGLEHGSFGYMDLRKLWIGRDKG